MTAEDHIEINNDPTHHAAIPRRSRRQPAAPRGAERGAREARQRRDRRKRAQGGRRPRDREGHQEAGGGRPQARHRRRIPPLVVAFRFLQGPRRRRDVPDRRRHPLRRRRHQGGKRARDRQGRLLRPSARRALQVSQGAHQGHAEDDHPGAVDIAFPAGPAIDQQDGLSRSRCLFRRRRHGLSEGDPRLLRRRLPLSAARRHRLVDDLRSEAARGFAQARRRSGQAAAALHAG